MRLAVVAHVRHAIRPPFAGGMEAHAWHLTRALVARGHDVTLFASGDSDPDLPVRPILDGHYDRDFPWHANVGTDRLNAHLDDAHARLCRDLLEGGFDAVHGNGLHRYPPRLARAHRIPMVTSLHVPPFDALRRAVHAAAAPWSRFTVTSAAQARAWWPEGALPEAEIVHNGIDLSAWPFSPRGDGTAAWAGRIAPNKGAHLAALAARAAGVPLTLYGAVEDRAYFEARVRPLLGPDVRLGGHLAGADLALALGRASACLFTPLWDEPFGLAALEAMACGLPVAATDRGAAREVIGDAGRYAPAPAAEADPQAHHVAALADALGAAMRIPRRAARTRAEGFALDRMVDAYEAAYAAARAGLRETRPAVEMPPIELRVAAPAPSLAAE